MDREEGSMDTNTGTDGVCGIYKRTDFRMTLEISAGGEGSSQFCIDGLPD